MRQKVFADRIIIEDFHTPALNQILSILVLHCLSASAAVVKKIKVTCQTFQATPEAECIRISL